MLESFDFNSPTVIKALTGKLEYLKKYNALPIPSQYFFEGMNRLRGQFLSVSLDTVVHPISDDTKQVTKEQQDAANDAVEIIHEQLNFQGKPEEIKKFYAPRNSDAHTKNIHKALQE